MRSNPRIVYNLQTVLENYLILREILDSLEIKASIAFACKAAPYLPLLSTISTAGAAVLVSTRQEAELARIAGFLDSEMVVDAPTESRQILDEWPTALHVLSHPGQWRMDPRQAHHSLRQGLLRVRVDGSDDHRKRGIGIGGLEEAVSGALSIASPDCRWGLHFHSRHTFQPDHQNELFSRATAAWRTMQRCGANPSIVDLGGGLPARTATKWRAEAFTSAIARFVDSLDPRPVHLILEPGTYLAASAAKLYLHPIHWNPSGGQVFADGGAACLPDANDEWRSHGTAPLRIEQFNDDVSKQGLVILGPGCVPTSDAPLLSFRIPYSPQLTEISVEGVGAYHARFAGAFGPMDNLLVQSSGLDAVSGPHVKHQFGNQKWSCVARSSEQLSHFVGQITNEAVELVDSVLCSSTNYEMLVPNRVAGSIAVIEPVTGDPFIDHLVPIDPAVTDDLTGSNGFVGPAKMQEIPGYMYSAKRIDISLHTGSCLVFDSSALLHWRSPANSRISDEATWRRHAFHLA